MPTKIDMTAHSTVIFRLISIISMYISKSDQIWSDDIKSTVQHLKDKESTPELVQDYKEVYRNFYRTPEHILPINFTRINSFIKAKTYICYYFLARRFLLKICLITTIRIVDLKLLKYQCSRHRGSNKYVYSYRLY